MYESQWKNWLINFYSLMGTLVVFGFVILPGLYGIYCNRHDMFAIIDNLQYNVPMAGAFIKCLDAWFGREALAAVMQDISNDWAKPKRSGEREVMLTQVKLCRMIFKVTAVVIGVPACLMILLPLFGVKRKYNQEPNERPLPIPSRFFFDMNVSPNYELIYFAQTCGSVFAVLVYTGIDNFIVLLILHLRGQLRNLRSRMLVIGKSKTFKSDLVANVNEHIRFTRTIGIMDSIFARSFAGVLVYFTIPSCMNSFMVLYLVQMDGDVATLDLSLSITILLASSCHSALYCIMGELLLIELEEIHNAVCATEWEQLKPDDARQLMIVMAYASTPISLTAAKVVPINMTTFCAMLRITGGYVSFLFAQLQ